MRKTLIILCTCALLGILAAYEVPASSKTSTTQVTSQISAPSQSSGSGQYKDGTFAGSVASNQYEDIQIAIVVQGGKITMVTTPQLSSDSRHSDQINNYAIPQLKEQVISRQSASIDGVSGASYTTQSYIESLQAALDKARA